MHTLEYQMLKACSIADANDYAQVGLFCNFKELQEILKEYQFLDGKYFAQRREFISECGGSVRFIDVSDVENVCAGAQFSHVFVNKIYDYKLTNYIRSRIRTTKEFTEAPGYYDEFGVIRYERY